MHTHMYIYVCICICVHIYVHIDPLYNMDVQLATTAAATNSLLGPFITPDYNCTPLKGVFKIRGLLEQSL